MSQMAAYSERNGRTGLGVDMKEPFEGEVTKTEGEGKHAVPCSSKDLHQPVSAANGSASGVASFSTNPNSVVCLPLVSEGLKLVWTHSDQTRELDSIPELVQAFNLFPYPTTREVNALARVCALTLDKVKVWFMVQRIKYGISWASEEIEETRRKLAVPEISGDYADTKEDVKMTARRKFCEEITEDEDTPQIEGAFSTVVSQKAKRKYESPETYKPARSTVPCFSSSLPPPQDSYNYRPPADTPATTAADVSLDLSDSSVQQRRHGRYKKSKAQLAVLRSSFVRENWPAETELRRLQEETGLSRNDIRKWFSDSRYQLRIGRGVHAAAQVYAHQTTVEGKEEPQQVQPLPLIAQKSRQQRNDKEVKEGVFSSDLNASHFFQTFLSNSLQAFGERSVLEISEEHKGSGEEEHCKDEEEWEEKPLQLTKTSIKTEAEVPQQPLCVTKSSPSSSLSGTPPPTASPHKQVSNGQIGTSKKSSTPSRLSGAPSSTSPALTPGGRPRKTKDQLDVLKQHFLRCQWPKSEDYTELVKVTGLPRADIIQWFGDTRYAVKNGQLRWVQGVREQFLAELATLQGSNGLSNGNSGSGAPRVGGSRKRKSQANGTNVPTDSPDTQPLEAYRRLTGVLHEKDLDSLCKKSRMSYQQVRDWFSSQESGVNDQESNVTD